MRTILVYVGIATGIFFEGEMTMISAVVAGHHGYVNISAVIVLGIIGAFTSDILYFFIGRKKGKSWLVKHPKYKKRAETIFKKLNRAPLTVFISYRFLYGFRTVAPLIIGTSIISAKKFIIYSFVSSLIWASVFALLGYYIGDMIVRKLHYIQHIEKYIIGMFVLLGIVLLFIRQRKKVSKPNSSKIT